MKISYAITAHSEKNNLQKLIPLLIDNKEINDEIVILFDSKNGDVSTLEYLLQFNLLPNVKTIRGFDFNFDYAKWKNKLNELCTGDYIFQIDGDEFITPILIKNLKRIIELNESVDLFRISRVNIVNGISEEDILNWNWHQNERGWINWPDKQDRIYRKGMVWSNKVHEKISNAKIITSLPEEYDLALIHVKNIARQKEQNEKYMKLLTNKI